MEVEHVFDLTHAVARNMASNSDGIPLGVAGGSGSRHKDPQVRGQGRSGNERYSASRRSISDFGTDIIFCVNLRNFSNGVSGWGFIILPSYMS